MTFGQSAATYGGYYPYPADAYPAPVYAAYPVYVAAITLVPTGEPDIMGSARGVREQHLNRTWQSSPTEVRAPSTRKLTQ
jgi:hypothetical protein